MPKSLVKNSIYNIAYKMFSVLYPIVAVTYVSHILLAEKMGMVSYAQNIVSYFIVISSLGIPTYGIREIAIRSNNKNDRSQLFWELFLINFFSTTISLIAFLVLVYSVNKFRDLKILYLIAGLQIVFNYLNVDWFYQGLEEYKFISIRSIVVKLIALAALPLMIHSQEDYLWYALIYCLAIGGNNILNIIRIRKFITKPKRKLNIKKHMKPVSTLLIVSVAVEIYAMIDTTMLGVYTNDTTVGCYANAMKIIRIVSTTAAAMGAVLFPRLSLIIKQKDKYQFSSLVNRGMQGMLMLAIPATVGMIVCGDDIVMVLFGESFVEAIPILKILSLMMPVIVFNTLMGGQVLVSTNQENKYVMTVVIASITNVILNAILIPRFGAKSAAVASIISELIDLTLYSIFARKYVIIKLSKRYYISILIPLILFVFTSKLVISKLVIAAIYRLIINMITCCLFYFGIGYILKNEAIIIVVNKLKEILTQLFQRNKEKPA